MKQQECNICDNCDYAGHLSDDSDDEQIIFCERAFGDVIVLHRFTDEYFDKCPRVDYDGHCAYHTNNEEKK